MYKYIDIDIHPQHDQCNSMCRRSLVASTSQPLRLRPNRYLCVLMLHALGISTLRCVAHRADRVGIILTSRRMIAFTSTRCPFFFLSSMIHFARILPKLRCWPDAAGLK